MRDTTIDPTTVSREIEESAARSPRLEVDEGHRPGGVTARQTPRPSAHPAPSSSHVVERMDRAVARLLLVQPQPLVPREAVATTSSWPFETPLLVSAVRCTVRYMVLPFVLPLLGVATGAALAILLTVDVIAAIAIVATLCRLWRLQHPRRWQYLLVALALAVLVGFFFMSDTRVLFV
jgi:hypothetical protein